MTTYRFSHKADLDLANIVRYTAQNWGEHQAKLYPDQIKASAEFIAKFPDWGKPYQARSGKTYRRYRAGEHYLFYRPVSKGILIVRILWVRRDFDRHL